MAQLLHDLAAWVSFIVSRIAGANGPVTLINYLFMWNKANGISTYFYILFIIAPIVLFALVGIWKRFIRKS